EADDLAGYAGGGAAREQGGRREVAADVDDLTAVVEQRGWRLAHDRPGVAGRGWVDVTGGVGGAHLEGVDAGGQVVVADWAGAAREARAVERALERQVRRRGHVVGAAEAQRCISAAGGVRRHAVDRRLGRRAILRLVGAHIDAAADDARVAVEV